MNRLKVSPKALAKRLFLKRLLGGAAAAPLAGCDALNQTTWFPKVLGAGEAMSRGVHHALGGRDRLAQEFTQADLSPSFRGNGNMFPQSPEYEALARGDFGDWKLVVDGLVETPAALSLAQLRAMPSRTQITRHDCVEGWSAIGKWTGVPLTQVLALVKPKAEAKYVVFHCYDSFDEGGVAMPYYESIDLLDAHHPQTILAYGLNDKTLPIQNGAPLRLRVERQLGYKQAKYLRRIELVDDYTKLHRGKGGYWEDNGYAWYAGI